MSYYCSISVIIIIIIATIIFIITTHDFLENEIIFVFVYRIIFSRKDKQTEREMEREEERIKALLF